MYTTRSDLWPLDAECGAQARASRACPVSADLGDCDLTAMDPLPELTLGRKSRTMPSYVQTSSRLRPGNTTP